MHICAAQRTLARVWAKNKPQVCQLRQSIVEKYNNHLPQTMCTGALYVYRQTHRKAVHIGATHIPNPNGPFLRADSMLSSMCSKARPVLATGTYTAQTRNLSQAWISEHGRSANTATFLSAYNPDRPMVVADEKQQVRQF